MKETYSINDVAMITSLSTRTIRTYISTGFLNGETEQDGEAIDQGKKECDRV